MFGDGVSEKTKSALEAGLGIWSGYVGRKLEFVRLVNVSIMCCRRSEHDG